MSSSIPCRSIIHRNMKTPDLIKKCSIRKIKYIHSFKLGETHPVHFSKMLSRVKLIRYFKVHHCTKHLVSFFKCLIKFVTKFNRTCRILIIPSDISLSFSWILPFINLQTFILRINKQQIHDEFTPIKHAFNPYNRIRRIREIGIDAIWTKNSLSKVRTAANKISKISYIQNTFLKVEEVNMPLYLHSFHTLSFYDKLHTLNVTIETLESFGAVLEYAYKMNSLRHFKLKNGCKFSENAVKNPQFSLQIANKVSEFPNLTSLELSLDFRGIIQQTIQFLTNIKYPKSLAHLELKLMVPDFDTLIQKANKSLSLVTYLSVENQPPFKEFIKNHENLTNLQKFKIVIETKRMEMSHIKLFRALTAHMKILEEVDITTIAEQGKHFLYLGLYNTLLMGEKMKKIKLQVEPSYVDFSGTELLEIDNRLHALKEISISCSKETIQNIKMSGFFKSIAIESMEKMTLDFWQQVTDIELEKKFKMLGKCIKLRKLWLMFDVTDFSDVSLEEIWKFITSQKSLEKIGIILKDADVEEIDMKKIKDFIQRTKRIRKVNFTSDKFQILRKDNENEVLIQTTKGIAEEKNMYWK